jgi:calcium-dependent protein kinase
LIFTKTAVESTSCKSKVINARICRGGELFERIIKNGTFSEKQAARIFKQMLSSLAYMHEANFCHRDLKPENFMFEDESKSSMIKLIDFGLSINFYDIKELKTKKMKTFCGTSFYMAPEIIQAKGYD